MRRQAALLGFALCSLASGATPDARAESLPTPRFHGGVNAGAGVANAGSTWVAGAALEGRLGARLAEWLSLDAVVMLENCLLCGRSNVGALIEFLPGSVFTLGFSGGVGGLYALKIGIDADTASYGFGAARMGFRFARASTVMSIGLEGLVGSTYAGTESKITVVEQSGYVRERERGTLVAGARLFFGMETP